MRPVDIGRLLVLMGIALLAAPCSAAGDGWSTPGTAGNRRVLSAELANVIDTARERGVASQQTRRAEYRASMRDLSTAFVRVDAHGRAHVALLLDKPRHDLPEALSKLGAELEIVNLALGRGIRVGVISDGYAGLVQSQRSGDLPAGVRTYGSCTPRPADYPRCVGELDCAEGTALAEIVHDIAPAATIGIAAVFGGSALGFVDAARSLVEDFRADIIVDDLGFYFEPYFEDGFIADGIAALDREVLFISSAGNRARGGHYEVGFSPNSRAVPGQPDHDFGIASGATSDLNLPLEVDANRYAFVVLQWDDPYAGATSDYALGVFKESRDRACDSCVGNQLQNGTQRPLERVCFHNDSSESVSVDVGVRRFSGRSARLEMFVLGRARFNTYDDPRGSIFGHAALPRVLTVGAIDVSDEGLDDLEPFSSLGPARIVHPSFELRQKPDVVSFDGVSVSGAGGFPTPFFGTSASAPHVAGFAALLAQAYPGASPARLRERIREQAIDLGQSGPDNEFGWGRVDAGTAYKHIRIRPALPSMLFGVLED